MRYLSIFRHPEHGVYESEIEPEEPIEDFGPRSMVCHRPDGSVIDEGATIEHRPLIDLALDSVSGNVARYRGMIEDRDGKASVVNLSVPRNYFGQAAPWSNVTLSARPMLGGE